MVWGLNSAITSGGKAYTRSRIGLDWIGVGKVKRTTCRCIPVTYHASSYRHLCARPLTVDKLSGSNYGMIWLDIEVRHCSALFKCVEFFNDRVLLVYCLCVVCVFLCACVCVCMCFVCPRGLNTG